MSYFTYQAIGDLLASLHERFGLFPLSEWQGQPGIVLRHDVDLDVTPAYDLSRREMEVNVRGSYFFLTTAATYNCQSLENRKMIRQLSDDGFEIGLHFDPSIYQTLEIEELGRHARAEASQLEDISGKRVLSVSLHNPSISNQYPMLPGWLNAYDERIFKPEVYLADSRMQFREDPSEFFSAAGSQIHQLLLHPMHYGDEEPLYPLANIAYLRRVISALDQSFQLNSTYRQRVGSGFVALFRESVGKWE